MKISVIVPVHNVRAYLSKCIKSILNQTYGNLEIILVDDGSEDDSGNICDRFQSEDQRIVVIHQGNGGLVFARKAGIAVATGDYITFVDGDDYIEKDMYEELLQAIGDADFIHTGYYDGNSEKMTFEPAELVLNQSERQSLLHQMLRGKGTHYIMPSVCSKLTKRELMQECYAKVPDTQTYGEDLICTFHMIERAKKIILHPRMYYHATIREESLSRGRKSASIQAESQLWQCIKEVLDEYHQAEQYKRDTDYFYMNHLMMGLRKWSDNPFFVEQYRCPVIEKIKGKRILLYGANDVGADYYSSLMREGACEIVAWVDRNYSKFQNYGVKVISPDRIQEYGYDYILLAILREGLANAIRESLVQKAIAEEKILWKEPIDWLEGEDGV